MIQLSPQRAQTMRAIHGWTGVCLGLLLYIVLVTGATSVFSAQIGDWSNPWLGDAPPAFSAGTNRSVHAAAASIDPAFYEAASVYPIAGDRLWAFFHRHEVGEDGFVFARGVGIEFDRRDGSILVRYEGSEDQVSRLHETTALPDFLTDLHVSLHLPFPWGMLLTGTLGLSLLVLTISGLFFHRTFIRDLFTLRRQLPKILARDRHAVAGSWILPFAVMLAFTGCYLSLFVPLGMPVLANVGYGGNQAALLEAFEGTTAEDARPATISDLDALLDDARRRSGTSPRWMEIHGWGRADSTITLGLSPRADALRETNYVYSGASGAFLFQKPALGTAPSVGGAVSDLIGPLHFGDFAGVASKVVWFSLGSCCAYVTLSGLLLWTQRRQEVPLWRRLGRVAIWVGYGLPSALVSVALGYFLARAADAATYYWMLAAFLLSVGLAALITATTRDPRRWLLTATAAMLLMLPLVRWISGGPSWPALADAGLVTVIATDLALLIGGAFALRSASRTIPAMLPLSAANAPGESG